MRVGATSGVMQGRWTSPGFHMRRGALRDGQEGALKALRRRAGTRRLGRFADEIEFRLTHQRRDGIVPLRDAHLPESATGQDRPWLVMSCCTPLRKALTEREGGVDAIVDAVATIAETLAGLAEDGVHHRDVKPDNPFERDGEWLVGDFGLVDYPEKPEVTARGERMGPMHFMAPEMLEFTDEADAELADVYSLAKSFWALLAAVNFPPPGPHRMGEAAYAVGSFVSHERITPLDLLIARATRHSPEDRLDSSFRAQAEVSFSAQPRRTLRWPS